MDLQDLQIRQPHQVQDHRIMPIVEPIGDGTLRLASRISSKDISIIKSSTMIGKGIDFLIEEMANASSVGRSS